MSSTNGPNPGPDPDSNQRGQDHVQPGPFKCNVCQRTYARIDHLARHFRSHTSEKPYRCEVCLKTFNRPDLLKRHAQSHADSPQHRKTCPSRPGRVSQACKACAAAKLKCNEEKPCRRCEAKGMTCEYNEPIVTGSWQQSSSSHDTRQQNMDNPLSEDTFVAHTTNEPNQSQEHDIMDYTLGTNSGQGEPTSKHGEHVTEPAQSRTRDDMPMSLPMDTSLSSDALIDCDESEFADFLREVMMPTTLEPPFNGQQALSQGTDAQSIALRDVLSFGLESNLDFNDQDYTLMDFYQGKADHDTAYANEAIDNSSFQYEMPTPQSNAPTKKTRDRLTLGIEAFRKSLWCWTPVRTDTGSIEQENFTLHPSDMSSPSSYFAESMRVNIDSLNAAGRDKIISMVLSTSSRSSFTKVMSSFPSVELLHNLIHCFLAFHIMQSDTWIHAPTLKIEGQNAELLGSIVSAGAALSTSLTIRKLGFAIHEAVRKSIPIVCDGNNSMTRDLGLLQAMVLNLDVGLWSGNKRKMELAESHSLTLITMCRRAGRFLRSNYVAIVPLEGDEGEILENKWRSWAHQESFKRLVFHLFIRDAQTSISLMVPTIISYAELSLPLPESRNLFLARTATEWKSTYLSQTSSINSNERMPSLQQCLHDISRLNSPSVNTAIDTALSHSIIAYGIWGLILEYRQLNSVAKAYPSIHLSSSFLVLGHRHQELCELLQSFSASLPQPGLGQRNQSSITLQSKLLTELLITNLYVSFNSLQVFAGREGEEEARRVYPSLQQWAASREARTAVFHAGQIVRYAKLLNNRRGLQGGLRDFFAVAVYHSALTLWAFGILSLRPSAQHDQYQPELSAIGSGNSVGEAGDNSGEGLVRIDVEESVSTKSFISLQRGIPCFSVTGASGTDEYTSEEIAILHEPDKVMNVIVKILRGVVDGNDEETPPPPLLENLSQLIRELGVAARGVIVK
ncbi:hypothetical protein V498_06665 [Pseudogymnoascus sp. VKM F-4517 (FW-2822)]|nr:hypothetical protein V498_06665 [Pseudogymnoascus sp. VKM F-4517 (FW-2822)]